MTRQRRDFACWRVPMSIEGRTWAPIVVAPSLENAKMIAGELAEMLAYRHLPSSLSGTTSRSQPVVGEPIELHMESSHHVNQGTLP